MNNFQELKNRRPELAMQLEKMSKEELLERMSIEIREKEDMRDDQNYFENDIEHIVNLGIKWLKKNRKESHYIFIKKGESRVTYSKDEINFI